MKYWHTTITFIFIGHSLLAQQDVHIPEVKHTIMAAKYIIIDTVTVDSNFMAGRKDTIPPIIYSQDNLAINDNHIKRTFPNFFASILYVKGYFPDISIIIDDRGSNISIIDIEKAGDTLHIKKLHLAHNCLKDKKKNEIDYYHYIHYGTNDSSASKLYRVEKLAKKKGKNSVCSDTLKSLRFEINNLPYTCNLEIAHSESVNIAHGFVSGRDREKSLRNDKNEWRNRSYRYNYFVVDSSTTKYYYSGEIQL